MEYRARHVTYLYKIKPETLNDWVIEFNKYLSVPKKSGRGHHRKFSPTDCTVIGYIKELREQDFSFDEIHVNLSLGNRIDPPIQSPQEIDIAIKVSEVASLGIPLGFEEQDLLAQVNELEARIIELQSDIKAKDALIEMMDKRMDDLLNRLQEASSKNSDKIQESYSRGFADGMKSQPPTFSKRRDNTGS